MGQETSKNRQKDPTLSAKKSAEKLPLSTDYANNNFVLSDAGSCINNITRSEKKEFEKHRNNLSKLRLLIVGDSIAKNKEPHKMKRTYKIRYNGKIDSWSNNRGNDLQCQRLYG